MKLIGCGDSWCSGAEIYPPNEERNETLYNRTYTDPDLIRYREENRYLNKLGVLMNAEVVDLSKCSGSNDAIKRVLFEYLSQEGYFSGRDPSDIFVSIGWSSPERTELYYKKEWGFNPLHKRLENWMEIGPWSMYNMHIDDRADDDLREFLKIYCLNFWETAGFLHRYINTIWSVQQILEKFNIRYIMHQAFYHHFLPPESPTAWDDQKYKEKFNLINEADKILWTQINRKTFVNIDDTETPTLHKLIIKLAGGDQTKVMEDWHPNADGHTLISQELLKWIQEKNLL